MKEIVKKSIEELNDLLPKQKKLLIENSTPLIDEKSNLDSIDLVNLFINLEKNLKKKNQFNLTFDELTQNIDKLKTIGSLENFLNNKLKK